MRTRNEEQFAQKRQDILNAAATCFVTNGFHQTSMQEICVASNMSPGGLYRYFSSKAEIIRAIAETEKENMEALCSVANSKKNPEKSLLSVLEAAVESIATSKRTALDIEILAESLRNEEIAKTLEDSQTALRDALQANLKRAKKDGRLGKEIKVNATVSFLLLFIRTLSLQASTDPNFSTERVKPMLPHLVRVLLKSES